MLSMTVQDICPNLQLNTVKAKQLEIKPSKVYSTSKVESSETDEFTEVDLNVVNRLKSSFKQDTRD